MCQLGSVMPVTCVSAARFFFDTLFFNGPEEPNSNLGIILSERIQTNSEFKFFASQYVILTWHTHILSLIPLVSLHMPFSAWGAGSNPRCCTILLCTVYSWRSCKHWWDNRGIPQDDLQGCKLWTSPPHEAVSCDKICIQSLFDSLSIWIQKISKKSNGSAVSWGSAKFLVGYHWEKTLVRSGAHTRHPFCGEHTALYVYSIIPETSMNILDIFSFWKL